MILEVQIDGIAHVATFLLAKIGGASNLDVASDVGRDEYVSAAAELWRSFMCMLLLLDDCKR
jgi:hypothetical protein